VGYGGYEGVGQVSEDGRGVIEGGRVSGMRGVDMSRDKGWGGGGV